MSLEVIMENKFDSDVDNSTVFRGIASDGTVAKKFEVVGTAYCVKRHIGFSCSSLGYVSFTGTRGMYNLWLRRCDSVVWW